MQNNETWLIHSQLTDWVWKREDWVRNLGWVDKMLTTILTDWGWHLFGNAEIGMKDYIDIVTGKDAEKRLYCFKNGKWEYINGPVLFVYKKNELESFIVGYAGPAGLIRDLEGTDPWTWPNITIVETEPVTAVRTRGPAPEGLPVIFMSNGETEADINWSLLKNAVPRAVRLDGISGRRLAFQEAAKMAGDHSHFFVVTGKNRITRPEVFDYRPQNTGTKHSVFLAKNMSNDLITGHMAIGCYNTHTVLNTPVDFGLDFTEAGGIVTIPVLASEANFATSPMEAWRTAFRETVKLTLKDDIPIINANLQRWLNYAVGPYADWVLLGAQQGHEYAKAHRHNRQALLSTVEWDWLKGYWDSTAKLRIV